MAGGSAANREFPGYMPTGYRFKPHDHELVVDYLYNKATNRPVPPNKIVDVNVYMHSPDELCGLSFLLVISYVFLFFYL